MKVTLALLFLVVSSCGNHDQNNELRSANASESNGVQDATPISNIPTHSHPLPRTISGGVLNEKAIYLPQAAYPRSARGIGASGDVTVQVLVDEEGKVVSASATSGHPLFQAAAVRAARLARFNPTTLSGGQPVKVSGVLNYTFDSK
jgi:TonB family protein